MAVEGKVEGIEEMSCQNLWSCTKEGQERKSCYEEQIKGLLSLANNNISQVNNEIHSKHNFNSAPIVVKKPESAPILSSISPNMNPSISILNNLSNLSGSDFFGGGGSFGGSGASGSW